RAPARRRAHRGKVAQVHRKRAVAERVGGDRVVEMHARDQRVDGDDGGAADSEHRGVVPDAEQHVRVGRRTVEIASDDLELAEAHPGARPHSGPISFTVLSSTAFTNLKLSVAPY